MADSEFDKVYKAQLARKLQILEEIRDDAQSVGVDLPGVVVCGAQSAGKSSVLESITGINFPRGENLCTRCPSVVQLVNSAHQTTPKVLVSLHPNYEGAVEMELGGVADCIREKSHEIAGAGITQKPIYIKVIRNDGPVMTFVDLPGITHVNPEETSDTDIHEVTAGMVEEYVKNPHMINLIVIPATDDFGNSEALKIAMRHDPEGSRTLGVVSKIDYSPDDSDIVKRIMMERSSDIKLSMGFIAVKNRSPDEVSRNISVEELYAAEERLFNSHKILKNIPKERRGHNTLVEKVVRIQSAQVDKHFPEVQRKLRQKMAQATEELKKLPAHCETVGERRGLFTRSVNDFTKRLSDAISGKDTTTHLASELQRLAEQFAHNFSTGDMTGDIPDYFSDEFGAIIEADIASCRGHTLDNFLSETIFRNKLNSIYFDGYLQGATEEFLEKVHGLMSRVCVELADKSFKHSSNLYIEVKPLFEEYIDKHKEEAKNFVMDLLRHEKRVTFTLDKSYMELINKLREGKCDEIEQGEEECQEKDKENALGLFGMFMRRSKRVAYFVSKAQKAVAEQKNGVAWARYEMQLTLNSYAAVIEKRLCDTIPLTVKSKLVYEPSETMAEWLNEQFSDERLKMSMQEDENIRFSREN